MTASPSTPNAFVSPFAPLQLSRADVETLDELSRVILRNYVAQYEAFAKCGGVDGVDKRSWRLVKQVDSVRAFMQRSTTADVGTAELAQAAERYSTDSAEALAPSDLPVVLIAGSVPGTLEDYMFGVVAPTTDASRVRTAYVRDDIGASAILATLEAPTLAAPFDSHVVRWVHLTPHNVLGRIVSDRDFIYLERTGIAVTSTGERIGFQMLHSITFPQTPELSGLIRGNLSSCGIYRLNNGQQQQQTVDVYLRTIVDARGAVLRPVVILSAVDAYIAIAKYMEIALRRKLVWYMREHQRKAAAVAVGNSDSSSRSRSRTSHDDDPSSACAFCSRQVSKSRGWLARDLLKYECALCHQPVCATCRVRKRLCRVVSATGALVTRTRSFCCVCFGDVGRASAFDVAQCEIRAALNGGDSSIETLEGESGNGGSGSSWNDSYASSLSSE